MSDEQRTSDATRVPDGCMFELYSSRMCEVGTKGCPVTHAQRTGEASPVKLRLQAVARVRLMAREDSKWDLSPNDKRELTIVLETVEALQSELVEARRHGETGWRLNNELEALVRGRERGPLPGSLEWTNEEAAQRVVDEMVRENTPKARLDADGTAVPKTQLRGVVQSSAVGRGHINENQVESYVLKDTPNASVARDYYDELGDMIEKHPPGLGSGERAAPTPGVAFCGGCGAMRKPGYLCPHCGGDT